MIILDVIFGCKALVGPSVKSRDCKITCIDGVDIAKKKINVNKTPTTSVFLLQYAVFFKKEKSQLEIVLDKLGTSFFAWSLI